MSMISLCFGVGSRRRSTPQVSVLIDTEGGTRARLFTSRHLSEKVINAALKRMGLRLGPHDLLRAFAKHGRMRKNAGPGLSLDQVRLITHHGEVDPGNGSLIGSYALDGFLEEKIDIMKRWCDWLDRLEKKSC